MVIQYASDLHLEFRQNNEFMNLHPMQPKGDVLLLAGDIVPFYIMNKKADFFNYLSDHFKITYWIPGNHEYYHFDISERCGTLHEKIKSNVFLVNNTSIINDNIQFIFSTLWSQISTANERLIEKDVSDFQFIKYKQHRFSSAHFNQLHKESVAFLKQELTRERAHKKVVVTHHVPTYFHYPEKYKGNILNEAFAVELHDFIETNGPDHWIFGHHHFNTPDFKMGNTEMRTNQLGYVKYNEHLLFNSCKTFEI
ncbi:MAG: metallophosphoesterase [Ginsengibacter sp.]